MKIKHFTTLALGTILLSGCGKPDAGMVATVNDLKAQLQRTQAQLDSVQRVLTNVQAECDASYAAQTNLQALLRLNATAMTNPPSPKGADTIKYDETTGVPASAGMASLPRIVGVSSQVTETHDEWWRWSYAFYVGNPQPVPFTATAVVQFLDKDGIIVDHGTACQVTVPPFTTNRFSGFKMVTMPGAATVIKVNVVLD